MEVFIFIRCSEWKLANRRRYLLFGVVWSTERMVHSGWYCLLSPWESPIRGSLIHTTILRTLVGKQPMQQSHPSRGEEEQSWRIVRIIPGFKNKIIVSERSGAQKKWYGRNQLRISPCGTIRSSWFTGTRIERSCRLSARAFTIIQHRFLRPAPN